MELEVRKIKEQSLELINKANDMEVRTREQYDSTAIFLKAIKAIQKQVKETFDPIVDKTRAAWKESVAQKDKHLNPLVEAERLVKKKVLLFLQEDARKRKAEEDRLAAEARERERKEKAKLEKKAEKAEARGDMEKAEELREKKEEVHIPTPIIPDEKKKDGVSLPKIWKAKITDINLVPREHMLPDMVKLNKLAKAVKGTMQIPGVEFYFEETVSARSY